MELSIDEKRIVFNILVQIMEADFVEDPAEIVYLDKVFHEFNLDISEFDHMENQDMDYLCVKFSKFQQDKKDYSKKLFYKMAECDGYLDPREKVIVDRM